MPSRKPEIAQHTTHNLEVAHFLEVQDDAAVHRATEVHNGDEQVRLQQCRAFVQPVYQAGKSEEYVAEQQVSQHDQRLYQGVVPFAVVYFVHKMRR